MSKIIFKSTISSTIPFTTSLGLPYTSNLVPSTTTQSRSLQSKTIRKQKKNIYSLVNPFDTVFIAILANCNIESLSDAINPPSIGLNKVIEAEGCVETKLSLCNHKEAIIVSYWLNETSLIKFFHSPLHRRMMKDMKKIMTADPKAIAVFNETYRPLRSGRYFNEPQGLAKIYPAIES